MGSHQPHWEMGFRDWGCKRTQRLEAGITLNRKPYDRFGVQGDGVSSREADDEGGGGIGMGTDPWVEEVLVDRVS